MSAWVPHRKSKVALCLVFAAVLGMVLLARSHFRLVVVAGESMRPGLGTGDLLLVNTGSYRSATPKRGDIVVARCGGDWIVKRVVGLPGETLEIRSGHLYVNEVRIVEPHRIEPGYLHVGKGTLLEDRYALAGDNRAISPLLQIQAVVAKQGIIGKVVYALRLSELPSVLTTTSCQGAISQHRGG